MNEREDSFAFVCFCFGIAIGVVLGSIIVCVIGSFNSFILSSETATDICKNLVNDTAVVPSTQNGKLICTIPSYDSTTNIIVRKAGENK